MTAQGKGARNQEKAGVSPRSNGLKGWRMLAQGKGA
jgi:hypothetical protein